MRSFLFLCLIFFGTLQITQAQQTALTSDGKVVVLYENGTWKYADVKVNNHKVQQNIIQPTNTKVEVLEPIILKNAEVPKTSFIKGPSKKLAKHFRVKNIVRCQFTLISKDNKVKLKTDWKIMNGEAYSYFGFINDGDKLTLELIGGEKIDLIYTKEFEPKEFEKYGFSTYTAELDLSIEQLQKLQSKLVYKAYMNWGRRTEEYKVVNPSYFIKSIPEISK
jgi:hypothetical protein